MNNRARFEQWLWRTWRLVVRAHRFATRVRFSILAAAGFAILLLTPPGQDIVRAVATGPFSARPADGIEPDFEHLAWFAVGLYLLSLACWGGGRLVLATHFNWRNSDSDIVEGEDERQVETRLRRDLPIYFGAMPFVAAGCTFAVAPLREVSANSPSAQVFAAVAAPLLIFFVLPLWLAMFNLKAAAPKAGEAAVKSTRNSFGPLSTVLACYSALAAWHALAHREELGALGGIPIVLFVTALWVFGLNRRSALFTVPIAIVVGAAWTWGGDWARWQPGLILPLLLLIALSVIGFTLPASDSAGSKAGGLPRADDTFIPLHVPALTLLRLLWDRDAMEPHLAGIATTDVNPALIADSRHNAPVLRRFLWLAVCLLALHVALLIGVCLSRQTLPAMVGSGCMLALGLCGIASLGNALLFATQASRFPILTAFVVLALISSGLMDNHDIRVEPAPPVAALPARASFQSDPVAASFEQWRRINTQPARPENEVRPCIIIATEGGGIRAAFWTATILSRLQELSVPRAGEKGRLDFASHVFAISGVSGGSVGAAVFAALCADHRTDSDLTRKAATLAGRDHLAPTLAGLFYPDLLQRFVPIALLPDRAHFFEGSWEAAWQREAAAPDARNRMREGFLRLWDSPAGSSAWIPNLFLNATAVEDGRRIIAGSVPIWTGPGGQFVDVHDLHDHLRTAGEWRDLPLIAAAHASARFPLVSPPGRLASGIRAVDGGYFENSGATTALDVLRRVQGVQNRNPPGRPQSSIIFLFLRFGAEPALTDLPKPSATGPARTAAANPNYPRRNWLNETASILSTVLSTRDARGSYAADNVFNRYAFEADGIHVLSFTFSGESIPLSWSLSRRSCEAMLHQLPTAAHLASETEARDARGEIASPTLQANVAVARKLMELLYAAP